MHQSGAAGGHPDLADLLGHLGAALDRGQDLRVEAIDLGAQGVDIRFGEFFCSHVVVLLVWGFWCHPVRASHKKQAPDPDADRGALANTSS